MVIIPDEVVTGAAVNAIAVAGRRISAALAKPRGRRADDLDIAQWFETFRLTGEVPDLPDLSPALMEKVSAILNGEEIQAALQELLAARLTDAPEADAARAREVIALTLTVSAPEAGTAAEVLAGYYDDQICALVARLGVYEPAALAQIRAEAFATRMTAILGAIERHTAALSARPSHRTEAGFLSSYRRHVTDQHGKLEPPDFDRRRRIPIPDIYVPTTITEDFYAERAVASRPALPSLDVWRLATRLDRSVLLGDPGGGKTTAANVLMSHFAADEKRRVPFLVTLRDFAANDPPERSVVGHIEHSLETFYQCPAPAGLADLLLLTGRAMVIFDGLDELLDTARRADVTARVEHFCIEYPLAPVLVTSRIVGYDQARLDDRHFTCYRLGQLAEEQVGEFVGKWFAHDKEVEPGEAAAWTETFLTESANAEDLRTNPLMLSLLCILYRGEGSLPRDRAEIYEQCAMLMFRRWDARRRIRRDLRAGHQLEPTLRHLAWWLFTRDEAQAAVTERELVIATTEFLLSQGFESVHAAREAAREFVGFCRGRMWVFSDVGTTESGERLYAFTHRTFLEYFAAAYLAYYCDLPEQLAWIIRPHVARAEWWVVAELAMQIKDRTSNGGAQRIYAALLADHSGPTPQERAYTPWFLGLGLRSVDPSPARVRELTRQLFEETCEAERASSMGAVRHDQAEPNAAVSEMAWQALLQCCGSYRDTVADEVDFLVASKIRSGDQAALVASLRLTVSLPLALPYSIRLPGNPEWEFWTQRGYRNLTRHDAAAITAAEKDAYIRLSALTAGVITTRQALDMPGGPAMLFQTSYSCFTEAPPYFAAVLLALLKGWPAFGQPAIVSDLAAFGEYLIDHPAPPWLHGTVSGENLVISEENDRPGSRTARPGPLTRVAYLGAAAILLIQEESRQPPAYTGRRLGPLRHIAPYLAHRQGFNHSELPTLLVPDEFKQTFQDWAEGRVNFTAPADGSGTDIRPA
jgi:NACHT domain